MISALISGKLIAHPTSGISAGGHAWCRVPVACHIQGSKENEPDSNVVSLLAFKEQAERLSRLSRGDTVSASGAAKVMQWTGRDGTTRASLDLVANEILTAYGVKKKRHMPHGEGIPVPEQTADRQYEPEFDDKLTF